MQKTTGDQLRCCLLRRFSGSVRFHRQFDRCQLSSTFVHCHNVKRARSTPGSMGHLEEYCGTAINTLFVSSYFDLSIDFRSVGANDKVFCPSTQKQLSRSITSLHAHINGTTFNFSNRTLPTVGIHENICAQQ